MDEIITEKNYPIQGLWLLKSILRSLLYLIILMLYFWLSRFSERKDSEISLYISLIFIFATIFQSVITILCRATFHYSIEGQFLTLRQGILSKQERHIPYGVIQNIFVKQDLFDRIFGLASLIVENASQGAGAFTTPQEQKVFGLRIGNQQQQQIEIIGFEIIGFSGNKVIIPGLKKQNAETLKEIILQKIKENPIEDSQSGL